MDAGKRLAPCTTLGNLDTYTKVLRKVILRWLFTKVRQDWPRMAVARLPEQAPQCKVKARSELGLRTQENP